MFQSVLLFFFVHRGVTAQERLPRATATSAEGGKCGRRKEEREKEKIKEEREKEGERELAIIQVEL